MKTKRAGFTLTEVLISMAIIGVIMAISVQTIKIVKASYTSLAYFEFNNIQQIAAEMIAGKLPYSQDYDNRTFIHQQANGAQVHVITSNDAIFCNSLVKMANVAGSANCGSLFSVSGELEPYLEINNNSEPTFISTSGKKYYLSERTTNENISDEFGFRLLAVDLNGSRVPNVSQRITNEIPDIVTFMILDTGEIFPLGVAADNITLANGQTLMYINSKVKGYYYSDIERTDGIPQDCFQKTKHGNKQICNYATVYVPNHTKNTSNTLSFYSYREAYCAALGSKTSNNKQYCFGLNGDTRCPPSTSNQQFDVCRVENVKPVFRYNL